MALTLSTYRMPRDASSRYTKKMKERVNTYVALLFVTIAGAGAAMLILHVALDNNFIYLNQVSGASYSSLGN